MILTVVLSGLLMLSDNQGPDKPAEKIFFGHQSVGRDLLEGLARLKAFDVRKADGDFSAPGVYEREVGENEKPLSKLQDFSTLMQTYADQVDVAMFKFCYADFNADTDVPALFKAYAAGMDAVVAAHPGTTFAHVTAPLTVVQRGPKAWLRHLIGRPAWGEAENVKRDEFNTLLRARYQGKAPIFDLADLESHGDTGKLASYVVDDRSIPMLNRYYTRDGGHLSEPGQDKLAAGFVSFVHSLPKRR